MLAHHPHERVVLPRSFCFVARSSATSTQPASFSPPQPHQKTVGTHACTHHLSSHFLLDHAILPLFCKSSFTTGDCLDCGGDRNGHVMWKNKDTHGNSSLSAPIWEEEGSVTKSLKAVYFIHQCTSRYRHKAVPTRPGCHKTRKIVQQRIDQSLQWSEYCLFTWQLINEPGQNFTIKEWKQDTG